MVQIPFSAASSKGRLYQGRLYQGLRAMRSFLRLVGCAVAALGVLLAVSRVARADDQNPPAKTTAAKAEPFPANVREAWKKAGASLGWMDPDRFGWTTRASDAQRDQQAQLPAFRISDGRAGILANKLPHPDKPFGLRFSGREVTDAAIKELADLKQLQALDLSNTAVTD